MTNPSRLSLWSCVCADGRVMGDSSQSCCELTVAGSQSSCCNGMTRACQSEVEVI